MAPWRGLRGPFLAAWLISVAFLVVALMLWLTDYERFAWPPIIPALTTAAALNLFVAWAGRDRSRRAPIELIAVGVPYPETISVRREGESSFKWVNGIGDAMMAALSRGVDLVVPRDMFEELRDEFPPQLPPYIRIR